MEFFAPTIHRKVKKKKRRYFTWKTKHEINGVSCFMCKRLVEVFFCYIGLVPIIWCKILQWIEGPVVILNDHRLLFKFSFSLDGRAKSIAIFLWFVMLLLSLFKRFVIFNIVSTTTKEMSKSFFLGWIIGKKRLICVLFINRLQNE